MLRILYLVTFLPSFAFVQKASKKIVGTYVGTWDMTQWTYTFSKDNRFIFHTGGHFGLTKTIGQYHLSGDTLFLKSFPRSKQESKHFLLMRDTLLLDGDSCIIDLELGLDYCRRKENAPFFHQSRQRVSPKTESRKQNDE